MKTKPISNCPVCKIPVEWIFHDGLNSYGLNSYDCSNNQCSIRFTERIWFPSETEDFDFDNGHGNLVYFSFELDNHPIIIDYRKNQPQIIVHPKYPFGDPNGGLIVSDLSFDIDWNNLEPLKQKIKTWIIFS